MSRLDAFIRRMEAQRACIDFAAADRQGQPGAVLELGLGNGRTYDHLRQRFPGREIYVFDREVAAHPDCVPPDHLLRLGDFRETLPKFLTEGRAAVFIHADIGTANKAASVALAASLAPHLRRLLGPHGLIAGDQPMELPGLEKLALPAGIAPAGTANDGRYHLYRAV